MTLVLIILTGDGDSTQEVTVDNYRKALWLCSAGNKKVSRLSIKDHKSVSEVFGP